MHAFSDLACLTLTLVYVPRVILQVMSVCMMQHCRSVPDTCEHVSWMFQCTLCRLLSVVMQQA